MECPLVSVLIFTYNQEKYIGQAIESILTQKTDFPFEIIIGEDFSSDSTRKICIEFARNNPEKIKLLLSDENLGILSNYIRTLHSSNGEYIAFCEGDDYWSDPMKLQKQVDFLNSNSNFGIVHTNKRVLVGESFYEDLPSVLDYNNILECLLISNQISFLTVLARTNMLKKCATAVFKAAKERNWKMLDYPMMISIAMNYKIGFLNEKTVVYRLLPESASHTADRRKAYLFDKSSIDVKVYYYEKYQQQNQQITKEFHKRFKENIFHSRKRLIMNYGIIACGDLLQLLKTAPDVYFSIILNKLKRVFQS